MPEELVRTVGRYGILREIGRGGMGVVFLARQLDLDRHVALKEMASLHASEPMLARRFVRESRLAGSLTHANVVTVFDFFEHEGTPYIAMEWVERGSLRPYVGRMTLAQIGGVLEGLLAGLGAAEQRSIVHRDLKPENLMVTNDGSVKIADFGIAKATHETRTSAHVTATGTTIGTPAYMAPEQAMARDIGPWTDLYSVGCIAYELFTGAPPFSDADTPMAVMLRHISEPLRPAGEIADVDPGISEWIARMTAKDPRERPPSAAIAAEDLEELLLVALGPRWRREARLQEPPSAAPAPELPPSMQSSAEFESFELWRGPAESTVIEGIDVDGTGPDTGNELPTAVTRDALPTPPPATTTRLPEEPPPVDTTRLSEPSRVPEEEPAPIRLARAGGLALLATVLLIAVADGSERWNLFAAFSPIEAVGVAIGTWLVSRRPGPFTAGVLIGFGTLATAGGLALAKFASERLDAVALVFVLIVLAGALAILVAGVRALEPEPAVAADPGALVLALVGAALASVALFVNYDGFSSLWSEVGERDSAEFFFEPAVAVAAMLAGIVLLQARPRFAAGLLVAVGFATALHFLGVLVAAARAIGEPGMVGSAGYIGMLGGLIVLAAGAYARRVTMAR